MADTDVDDDDDNNQNDPNLELNFDLFHAVMSQNFDRVKELIESGADPNWHNLDMGMNCISMGVMRDNLPMLTFMIENGGSLTEGYELRLTPLDLVRSKAVLSFLINQGADPSIMRSKRVTLNWINTKILPSLIPLFAELENVPNLIRSSCHP
eukprot:TRINITY_DN4492_c0_g1_i2.p1 TRINITY_DN4492_c0_g1~~TRINITY_DN4492_c0_g1_i2.p1  ORF type:complete len:153 (-),score=26.78 TRINITY_DN4492_c0_g1_i2:98-556(-)